MKRILVMMATYNGERFLRNQIDSVLNQIGVEVAVKVFDDRSTDSTVSILEEYRKKCPNFEYSINEGNLGYKANFFSLINDSEDNYDYYSFCDQDDVWMDNKLLEAVTKLERADSSKPCAYFSNLLITDEDLNVLKNMEKSKRIPFYSRMNLILENKATGCTVVFNREMLAFCKKLSLDKIVVPHDEIVSRIALMYGEYIYDERAFIFYRQHGNNTIGAKKGGKLSKYFKMTFGKNKVRQSENIVDLIKLFGPSAISDLLLFDGYKKSFTKRMKLFFNHRVRKRGFLPNFVFKVAILIGKY